MKYSVEAKQGKAYDVVVCGGGTAGVMAAIAAGREGASVLLVERTFSVGGMLTVGEAGITKFTEHCRDHELYKTEVLDVLSSEPEKVQVVRGIPREYCMRMIAAGGALGTGGDCGSYIFTDRYCAQITLIDMLKEAGADVLYDSRVCMVNMDGNILRGVVVLNKEGFTEYGAKCFIDATGDADVAALSGVEYHNGASAADVAEGGARAVGQFHPFGCMYRVRGVDFDRVFDYLGENPDRYKLQPFGIMAYENARDSFYRGEMSIFDIWIDNISDPNGPRQRVQVYTLPARDEAILMGPGTTHVSGPTDGLNARDVSDGQDQLLHAAVLMTEKMRTFPGFENAYVCYIPDVGVRETRHIVGKYVLTGMDVMRGTDFEDSIACGGHPIDISPRPKEIEELTEKMNHWRFHIPYRIMVPEKVENLLVTGRCVSATRLGSGAIRPTAQCMAMGEAAGVAAAMAAKGGVTPADVDVKALRETLVKNGAVI